MPEPSTVTCLTMPNSEVARPRSPSEFKARQDRARVAIAAAGHRALIVTTPENIFWLTGRQTAGYFAFQALVMPVEGEATLLVRQLELVGSIANTWLNDIVVYQDGEAPAAVLAEVLRERGIHRPAIELGGWFLPPVLADEISLRTGERAHRRFRHHCPSPGGEVACGTCRHPAGSHLRAGRDCGRDCGLRRRD